MSDIELLHRAASEMHTDAVAMDDRDNEFFHAVADWLEACAKVLEVSSTAVKAHALKVARAYLGEEEDDEEP